MAIKIGSTTRIDNNGAATFTTITGTSISVSGDSNADRFKINGTSVISSSRAITATSITMSSTFQINNLNPRIELVGSGGTPYIDFRTGQANSQSDYDMRIRCTSNDILEIEGGKLSATMVSAKGLDSGFTTITVTKSVSGSSGSQSNSIDCPASSTLLFWSMTRHDSMDDGGGYPSTKVNCTASGNTLTVTSYEDNDANVTGTCLGLCAYT